MVVDTPHISLAAQLEGDRLRHRAIRLHAVVAVLRERAAAHRADGLRPADGLIAALREFEAELHAVRVQLRAMQRRVP